MGRYIYQGGCWLQNDELCVVARDEDILNEPHAAIIGGKDGALKLIGVLEWSVVAWLPINAKALLIGEDGQGAYVEPNRVTEVGNIFEGERRYVYTGGARLNNYLFAFGMGDLVLRRDLGGGQWLLLNGGLASDHFGTQSICCNNKDQCYLVGWDGVICALSGGAWTYEASPTNLILTSCISLDDGSVIACGQEGTLLKGRTGMWEQIDHSYTQTDFWKVFLFHGEVYVCGDASVFRLSRDELIPELAWHIPDDGVFASVMTTSMGYWVFSERKVFRYEHDKWV